MSLRKNVEHYLRYARSYIEPSRYSSASQARAAALPIAEDSNVCVFDFTSIKIDNDAARYLYHLVTDFEAAGYSIAYTDRFRFLGSMKSKACKRQLLNHSYSIVSPKLLPKNTKVLITDSPHLHCEFAGNMVIVNYDFKRPDPGDHTSIILPYFVHPDIHESEQVANFLSTHDLSNERPMSVLFAGNAKLPKYDSATLQNTFSILSRAKVIQTLEESLPAEKVRRPLKPEHLLPDSSQRHSLTIATTQDLRIPSKQWIETLAKSDFYLACPGVEMPLCHNLIESLAAGSIPILQYAEYLDPPLVHGVNCLISHDEESLIETVNQALEMNPDGVVTLKANAQAYYKTHLLPGSFAKKMVTRSAGQQLTLYIYAYHTPAPNHANSILLET